MPDCTLAFDFGTTNFKAGIVNASGGLEALVRLPTPITRDGDRVEIDPGTFLHTIRLMVSELSTRHPRRLEDVRAVTFATQANTFILLDDEASPLTPLIAWPDERARGAADAFEALAIDPDYVERSGVPVLNCQFAPAKLKWLSRFSPDIITRAKKFCFLGDYFVFLLTGAHVTEGSLAALCGLFNVVDWKWEQDWCDRAAVRIDWLPTVVRGGEIVGHVNSVIARELGLNANCPMVMGLLDQYAGAIGMGNDSPGSISETTGTVLASVRCSSTFSTPHDTRIFRGPAPHAGRFYQLLFGDVSGNLIETLRQCLPAHPSPATLDESVSAASMGRLHLDHRAPVASLRATIESWSKTQPADAIVASIYTAVANALADQISILTGDTRVELVRSGGGGARSRKWLQIKADRLQIPVIAPACDEPNLIGVCSLAAKALNLDGHWRRDIDQADQIIHPRARPTPSH